MWPIRALQHIMTLPNNYSLLHTLKCKMYYTEMIISFKANV